MKLLGKTDLRVSSVGLGADIFGSVLGEKEAFAILDAYVAAGGNFIDTARVYADGNSEMLLGRWLRRGRPQNVIVATKGAHYDQRGPKFMRLSREEIELDLNTSLRALGTECIDLYWLHRDDPGHDVGEILETMEALVRSGKIRHYGASNFRTDRLRAAAAYASGHGLQGFAAVSNQYSALRLNPGGNTNPDPSIVATDGDALAFHRESGLPLVPFQSTGRGYLAKLASGAEISPALRAAYENEENGLLYRRLSVFCREHHCSMQTATLVATATAPFTVIPLTSVNSVPRMQDVADAMRLLG